MPIGTGHVIFDARNRCSIMRTLVLPVPTRRATSRDGSPPSNVSLSISRTWRISSLSVGIEPSKRRTLRRPGYLVLSASADRHHRGILIAIMLER